MRQWLIFKIGYVCQIPQEGGGQAYLANSLLVIECCGTLGTAVNEAYFALFSMGAHGTGMTP